MLPLLEEFPSLARLNNDELAFLKIVRLLTPEQRYDLLQLGITLARKNSQVAGNVYLLADPKRKYRQ